MLDWNPLNNSGIRPEDLTSGSHQVVVWTCHKCGRRWSCQVRNRIQGTGCTCDAMARKTASLRKKLVARDGSLAEHRPDLAAQWHPTKNGDLSPWDVTCSSTYAAWWIDAMGREWKTQVSVRCRNPSPTDPPPTSSTPGTMIWPIEIRSSLRNGTRTEMGNLPLSRCPLVPTNWSGGAVKRGIPGPPLSPPESADADAPSAARSETHPFQNRRCCIICEN